MVRGIIVLPIDEKEEIFEREIDPKKGEHIDPLKEFLKIKKLYSFELENATSYMAAVYLAQLGYVVLHIAEFTLLYLPENISEFNCRYLKKNTYKYFKKSNGIENVGLISIEDKEIINYTEDMLEGLPPSKKLKELLRDKKAIVNQTKGK